MIEIGEGREGEGYDRGEGQARVKEQKLNTL